VTDGRGAALIDVLAATSLSLVLAGIAIPVIGGALERERTIVGAQYVAGQLQRARLDALKQGRAVAVRVVVAGERTSLQLFSDGNGNGVLQRDIDRAIDRPLGPAEWLDHQARDISLRVNQFVDDLDGTGELAPGDDPLRIGNTSLLAFSPMGSATSGTLYVAAQRGPQTAIRVFGATGRVRVLTFDAPTRRWWP
jgi:hypothetical protein